MPFTPKTTGLFLSVRGLRPCPPGLLDLALGDVSLLGLALGSRQTGAPQIGLKTDASRRSKRSEEQTERGVVKGGERISGQMY